MVWVPCAPGTSERPLEAKGLNCHIRRQGREAGGRGRGKEVEEEGRRGVGEGRGGEEGRKERGGQNVGKSQKSRKCSGR